jgi:hypothetical protein
VKARVPDELLAASRVELSRFAAGYVVIFFHGEWSNLGTPFDKNHHPNA